MISNSKFYRLSKIQGFLISFSRPIKLLKFVFVTDPKVAGALRISNTKTQMARKEDVNWIEQFVTLFDIAKHMERSQEQREVDNVEEEKKYLTSDPGLKRKLSPNAQERVDPVKRTHVANEEMEPTR
jgi:hypothetical protein